MVTMIEKTCPVCGKKFEVTSQRRRQKCCSAKCGYISGARTQSGKAIINNISKEDFISAIKQAKSEDKNNVPRIVRVAEILNVSNWTVSRLEKKFEVYISDYKEDVIRSDGYYQYTSKFNHRKVMEEHLGRKLDRSEVVHHIDGDRLNNDIDNLVLCSSISEHCSVHNSCNEIVYDLYKKGIVGFDMESKRYYLKKVK